MAKKKQYFSYRDIKECLPNRQHFRGNSMHSTTGDEVYSFARLPRDLWDFFYKESPYVVISWNTPIAWVMEDGSIFHVPHKFSSSTSRHQSLCRVYLRSDDAISA